MNERTSDRIYLDELPEVGVKFALKVDQFAYLIHVYCEDEEDLLNCIETCQWIMGEDPMRNSVTVDSDRIIAWWEVEGE